MRENLGAKEIQSKSDENPFVKAKLGGVIGVMVDVHISAEDGTSTLDFSFSYRSFQFIILIVAIFTIGLSLIWNTSIPGVILFLFFPLGYKVNSIVQMFLNIVNEMLPRLELEYAHVALMEERKRWQLEPKDTKELYRRLCEKHIKTWGNTHALEYKLNEYERQGLTREEAIRKTAEEEGIEGIF